MTLPKELEAGTATCAECGQITHYLLVDPVDGGGMVFCSWGCLKRYAQKRAADDSLEYNETHKGLFCIYRYPTFCQEGDCEECQIYREYQEAQK